LKNKILRHYLDADYVTAQKSVTFYFYNLVLIAVLFVGISVYYFLLPERLFLAGPPMALGILVSIACLYLLYIGQYQSATLLAAFAPAALMIVAQMTKLGGDFYTAYSSFVYLFTFPILITGLFSHKRFILPVSLTMALGNTAFMILLVPMISGHDRVNAIIGFISSSIIIGFTATIVFLLRRIMDNALDSVTKLNHSMSRFVPYEFLEILNTKSVTDLRLGDNRVVEMTVLFCDIRDFTSLTESLGHQQTFELLNDYFGTIGPIIRKNNGFIDKYIGDAIMALFPKADDAILAAGQMVDSLKIFNEQKIKKINFGIGVASGVVTLGAIGELRRIESTVISDVVNTASRLEELTKTHLEAILISGSTVQLASIPSRFVQLGKTKIRGKLDRVSIYGLRRA